MNIRGLTALELVVALAVTAVAATLGTATYVTVADQRDRWRAPPTRTESAAAVRRSIIEWLEAMHTAPALASGITRPTFQLVDHASRGRALDELLFETSAATPLGDAGADVLVHLYVDMDPRTPERGLVAEFTMSGGVQRQRLELDPAVAELDVRCLTDLLGSARWVSTWVSSAVLPRGVAVRLRPARGDLLDPLLQLPLTVAVSGGR